MGTSSSYEGVKPSSGQLNPQPDGAEQPDNDRHRVPRHNFTKFITSGGDDDIAFGRAIASCVGTILGGAKQAAGRMSSECSVSVELVNILSEANKNGIQDVIAQKDIKGLDLESLDTLSIPELYAVLVDVICPTGADRDDAMARDAYLNTIVDVNELGLDLKKPSPETVAKFKGHYISNAIKNRIVNEIATGLVTKPKDAGEAQEIEKKLKGSIHKVICDEVENDNGIIQADDMKVAIDNLYEKCYALLEEFAEEEANK